MSATYLLTFIDCFTSWTCYHDDISLVEDAVLLAVEQELAKVNQELTPAVAEYVRNRTLSSVYFWEKYLGCDPSNIEHPNGYTNFQEFYRNVLAYRAYEPAQEPAPADEDIPY